MKQQRNPPNSSSPRDPSDSRAGFYLFWFCLVVYLLTYRGLSIDDGMYHRDAACHWVNYGVPALPDARYSPARKSWFWKKGSKDRVYLVLPPGLTIAITPLTALGMYLENNVGSPPADLWANDPKAPSSEWEVRMRGLRYRPSIFLSFLVNPLFGALLVLVLFRLARRLGATRFGATLAALGLGVGSFHWYFATNDWTQPLSTLGMFSGFAGVLPPGPLTPSAVLFAGVCAGIGIVARYDAIFLLPWLFLALIWRGTSGQQGSGKEDEPSADASAEGSGMSRTRSLVLFLIPLALLGSLVLWWNAYRFGSPFITGSAHQQFGGLFGRNLLWQLPVATMTNLFSPRQGILFFAPSLLLLFAWISPLFKRYGRISLLCMGQILTSLFFFSSFRLWQTPESWGPRFLHGTLPLLFTLLALIASEKGFQRRVALGLILFGVALQIPGVTAPLRMAIWSELPHFSIGKWDLAPFFANPIVPRLKGLFQGDIELWWLQSTPGLFLGVLLLGLGGVLGRWALRELFTTSSREWPASKEMN